MLQSQFKIAKDETQYSLAFKTKLLFSRLLLIAIRQLNSGKTKYSKMRLEKGNYNYAPSRKERLSFREKNLQIVCFKDFFNVVMRPF